MLLRDNESKPGRKKKPKPIRPVAPYDRDPAKAAKQAFDRETGLPVRVEDLMTYAEVLRDYARHAEAKFLNGGALDRGRTERRLIHVRPENIHHIGKESNELDEDDPRAPDDDPVADWGPEPRHALSELVKLKEAISRFDMQEIAAEAGITRQALSAIIHGRATATALTRRKLDRAIASLTSDQGLDGGFILMAVRSMIEEKRITLRELARQINQDPSNLAKNLTGARKVSKAVMKVLVAFVRQSGGDFQLPAI